MALHATLPARLAELLAGLEQAETLFRQDVRTSGRQGARYAVFEVVKFLLALVGDEDYPAEAPSFSLPMPLLALAVALSDLDKGVPSPMLKAAKAGNATTTGSLDHLYRAFAASAMECLMMSGLSRADAARMVSKAIEGRSYAQGFGRDLWKVVARWRDDLHAPRADPNHFGALVFRMWRRRFDAFAVGPKGREALRNFAADLLKEQAMAGYPIRMA